LLLAQRGELAVALHLAVDIAAFTAVLYFTGGPSNPFVSLYLVPISLAATSLPQVYAWLTGALCGAGYALLWWRSVPLPRVDARFGSDFDLHLAGMWINFLIAAVLIVLFVGRMAWLVRQRDRELAAMHEQQLRDQLGKDLMDGVRKDAKINVNDKALGEMKF
jgi:two-component system sensor histidine kinase RegB